MIGIIDTGTCNLNSIKNIVEKEKKKDNCNKIIITI